MLNIQNVHKLINATLQWTDVLEAFKIPIELNDLRCWIAYCLLRQIAGSSAAYLICV